MSVLDIAHRGASVDAPENTLQAFELAVEQGADMIETDLHLLRDGTVGLYHGDEIDGVPLGTLTLDELRERRPAAPTLAEALDACGERIAFNLEIKRPRGGAYAGLEKRVLDEVRSRGILDQTLFSCFNDGVLETLRGLERAARLGLLISRRSAVGVDGRAERLAAEAVHLHRSLAEPERIDAVHAAGRHVHVYTVDDTDELRRMIERGVDGIFTNRPARLRELLD